MISSASPRPYYSVIVFYRRTPALRKNPLIKSRMPFHGSLLVNLLYLLLDKFYFFFEFLHTAVHLVKE